MTKLIRNRFVLFVLLLSASTSLVGLSANLEPQKAQEKTAFGITSIFDSSDLSTSKVFWPTDAETGFFKERKAMHLSRDVITLEMQKGSCPDGFSFSFDLAPLWNGSDPSGWRQIIRFVCRGAEGKRFNLSLFKHANGKLYFYVSDAEGFITIEESVMWLKGRWTHITGGCGKEGITISTEGSGAKPTRVGPCSSITALEEISFGGRNANVPADLWISNLIVKKGFSAVMEETPRDAFFTPLRVAPDGRWTLSPDLPSRCTGYIKRFEKDFQNKEAYVFLECPIGITPGEFMDFDLWEQHSPRRWSGGPSLVRNGQDYRRYYYQVPLWLLTRPPAFERAFQIRVALQTNLPYGTETEVGFGVCYEDGGKDESMAQIPVRVIQLGPAPSFRRLRVGLSQSRLALRVQGDYVALARRLGLNYMDLWTDWPPGIESKEVVPPADEAVARLREAKILPCLAAHLATLYRSVPAEVLCTDINGRQISGRCPSDRGPEFQKDLENCRRIAARGGGATFDVEMPGFCKSSGCFCPHCLVLFQDYLKSNYPKLVDADPKQFEKNSQSYPDQHKAWRAFIGRQASEWLFAYYQAVDEGRRQSRVQDQNPLMLIYDEGMWDSGADLSELFAKPRNKIRLFAGPPLYHGAPWVGENTRNYVALHPNIDVMPYVGFEYDTTLGGDMKSKVLETFGSGAKGILFWGMPLDAETIRDTMEGLNVVLKVEDLLADNKPIAGIKIEPKEANVCLIGRKDGDAVLLVSSYAPEKRNVKVLLSYKFQGEVVDLLTNQVVLSFKMGTEQIVLRDLQAARLFLLRRRR